MNEKTLTSFRTKLEEIRFTMMGGVKGHYKIKKDESNEQVSDIADEAIESYSRELIMGLGEHEWKKLRLVEDAIEKMKNGQYGICSECGKVIPEARLKIVPFTAHCIDCLEAIEKNNREIRTS